MEHSREAITFAHRLGYEEIVRDVLDANRVRGVTYRKEQRSDCWPAWLFGYDCFVITCPAYFADRLKQQLTHAERIEQGDRAW